VESPDGSATGRRDRGLFPCFGTLSCMTPSLLPTSSRSYGVSHELPIAPSERFEKSMIRQSQFPSDWLRSIGLDNSSPSLPAIFRKCRTTAA